MEQIITREMWQKANAVCADQGVHLAELIEDKIEDFDALYKLIVELAEDFKG